MAAAVGAVILAAFWLRRSARPASGRGQPDDPGQAALLRPYLVPRELPPAPAGFVGRDREVDRLVAGIREHAHSPFVAVIYGEPGIGKTALAITAAHRTAAFPGGQLFIRMRAPGGHPISIDQFMEHVVSALKGPDDPLPAARELRREYAALAAQYSVLFVLDDMPPYFDISAIFPIGATSAVIITCRTDPAWAGVEYEPIQLEALGDVAAVDMLRAMVGAPRPVAETGLAAVGRGSTSPADQGYLNRLARRCGGEPLALRAAGTALADRPNWDISLMAGRAGPYPAGLSSGGGRSTIFDAAYSLLTTDEQKALRVLGVIRQASFAPWMIDAALGIGEDKAERLAARLAEACLIERYDPGSVMPSYWAEDPVLSYARQRAEGADEPADIRRWRESVPPEQERRVGRLGQEFGSLDELLRRYGGYRPAIDAVRHVLSLAREQESRVAEAGACAALADLYTDLGEVVTAEDLARQAILIAGESAGAERSAARSRRCLTRLERRRGRFELALVEASKAEAGALLTGDRSEQVRILVEKANVLAVQRNSVEADRVCLEALRICDSLDTGASSLQLAVKWCQGRVWLHAGRYSDASVVLQEGRELAADLGEQRLGAWVDHTSAGVAAALQDWAAAERYAMAGMDIFTELRHRYGVAHCRHRLGQIRLQRDRLDDAIRFLRDSLESFHNCEDIWIESEVSLDLADAYLRSGRIQDAIQMQQIARRDYRQMGSSALTRRTTILLARTLLARVRPRYAGNREGTRPGLA